MKGRRLADEKILLTDDERRLLVVMLGNYEKHLSEEDKKKEGIQKQIKMKDVLIDKMWGR